MEMVMPYGKREMQMDGIKLILSIYLILLAMECRFAAYYLTMIWYHCI